LLELDAVEVAEQFEGLLGFAGPGGLAQVFDDDLRVNLFLDVNGHGGDFERTGILFVLALPDELRVERRVARVENFLRHFLVVFDEVAQFLGRDVGAFVLVLGGEDGRGGFGGFAMRSGIVWKFGIVGAVFY
jgi:hypothetical protein